MGLQFDETSKPSILFVTKLFKSTIVCVLEKEVKLDLNPSRVALKLE